MGHVTPKPPLAKCGTCGGALPCYSIAWSNLPPAQQCRCAEPVYTVSPILEAVAKWLRGLGR
jgi:hypothetical protein